MAQEGATEAELYLPPGVGHPDAIAQMVPALDDPLAADSERGLEDLKAAAAFEAHVTAESQFGSPGRQINRSSPFTIGFTATFGIATAAVLLWAVYLGRSLLTEVGLGLFIALGLDPIVMWLHRRGLPRWLAVGVVVAAGLGALAGIAAVVVPVAATQINGLVNNLPAYQRSLTMHSSFLGRINMRYHVITRVDNYVSTNQGKLAGGVIGVGKAVLSGIFETFVVAVISIYFLADMPRVKRTLYQMVPRSRRARVVLLSDEMFTKVGGYVAGNVAISIISGIATWVWAMIFGIPYATLLAILVAVFDLVPLVGSTIAGAVVCLVALTISLPLAIATAVFFLAYRLVEDYLLSPRIMGKTVQVPGIVTVIATLLGGALLGLTGALIAIPVAAAVRLILLEVAAPTMNRR